ncbi:MAG: polymer-forming cytoskeletal protein [Sinobacteraceae bacterium]|nr:polymer-forming cytoskeletal protein [Nevskia sp.]MDI3259911.1 polymer-forming cytoskeletal protein [Nevskiaceae bacterium]
MKLLGGGSSDGSSGKGGGVDTLIGRHTEVLGDVRFTGGLHLDGKIKGSVIAVGDKPATLSVSETGSIEGDVRVPSIVLNGSVIGDVRASERLSLAPKARVNGNVHYKVLQMEPGAMINGQLLYEGAEPLAALPHHKPGEAKPAEAPVAGVPENRRAKLG